MTAGVGRAMRRTSGAQAPSLVLPTYKDPAWDFEPVGATHADPSWARHRPLSPEHCVVSHPGSAARVGQGWLGDSGRGGPAATWRRHPVPPTHLHPAPPRPLPGTLLCPRLARSPGPEAPPCGHTSEAQHGSSLRAGRGLSPRVLGAPCRHRGTARGWWVNGVASPSFQLGARVEVDMFERSQ